MIELRRPDLCPSCQSPKVMYIQWGRPTQERTLALQEEIAQGLTTLGGCTLTFPAMTWECGACGHRWSDETDPAQQEIRESEQRVMASIQKRRAERANPPPEENPVLEVTDTSITLKSEHNSIHVRRVRRYDDSLFRDLLAQSWEEAAIHQYRSLWGYEEKTDEERNLILGWGEVIDACVPSRYQTGTHPLLESGLYVWDGHVLEPIHATHTVCGTAKVLNWSGPLHCVTCGCLVPETEIVSFY
jgi:hypothetical protein